jgi:hypothetical protein
LANVWPRTSADIGRRSGSDGLGARRDARQPRFAAEVAHDLVEMRGRVYLGVRKRDGSEEATRRTRAAEA